MNEFRDEMQRRVTDALNDLEKANAAGDLYSVSVHTGELESFARLADEHGLHVPELVPYRAA